MWCCDTSAHHNLKWAYLCSRSCSTGSTRVHTSDKVALTVIVMAQVFCLWSTCSCMVAHTSSTSLEQHTLHSPVPFYNSSKQRYILFITNVDVKYQWPTILSLIQDISGATFTTESWLCYFKLCFDKLYSLSKLCIELIIKPTMRVRIRNDGSLPLQQTVYCG